jgi:hypothetical protein
MEAESFDYVLVGSGPCGLTLATLLSSINKKVLIVERHPEIGGCHRIIRDSDGTFTEHGPRVYSDSYKNFATILKMIGTSFHTLFIKYNFTISNINSKTTSNLGARHLVKLSFEFIKLLVNPWHGSTESMYIFTRKHAFSKEAIDYIDRICRLTDGTDYTRYSLNQFLNLLNQNFFYDLYQPRIANDKGLFKIWKEQLGESGAKIITNSTITYLDNGVCILNSKKRIRFNRLVMCIPPQNILDLLKSTNIPVDIFSSDTESWVNDTRYNTYISCTFSWKEEIPLTKLHGFPISEWGIIFIPLSDYFQGEEYKTIISTNVSILDTISNTTGKTANESTSSEVIEEIYNQIKNHLNLTRKPDKSQLTPGAVKRRGGWESADTAFVNSSTNTFKNGYPIKVSEDYKDYKEYDKLYNIGTHSLLNDYKFTTVESAVVNSIKMFNILENQNFPVKRLYTLADSVYIVLVTLSIILLFKLR